jgi:hypothetical protein
MTGTIGSVPLGRTRTRPRPSERLGLALRRLDDRRSFIAASRSPTRTLTSFCGSLRMASALGQVGASESLEREQRGRDAVAGG